MNHNSKEYQRAYFRKNKAKRYKQDVERRRRARAEAQSYKAQFRIVEERRRERRDAEAAKRRQEQCALRRLLKAPLFDSAHA